MHKFSHLFHSIKFKVALLSIVLMIIPSLILGTIAYIRIIETEQLNTSTYIINNLRGVSNNIDDILYNIEYLSMPVISNESFLLNVKSLNNSGDNYTNYLANKFINSFLFEKNFLNKYINTIYLYTYSTQTTYSSIDTINTLGELEMNNSPWLKDFKKAHSTNSKWTITKSLSKEHSGSGYIVAYYKMLRLFSNNKPLGVISFNVNEANIYQSISRIKYKKTGYIFIIDQNKRVVSHTNRNLIYNVLDNTTYLSKITNAKNNEGYFIDKINGKESLISFVTSKYTGWKYIAVAPMSEVITTASIAKQYFFSTYIILSLLIVATILIISFYLYKPINTLFSHMKSLEKGNFSTSIPYNRKDEVGYIYKRFNSMVSNIKTLVNDLYVQKLLRKEAQIKVIQTQINEHFLYNTLNSIYLVAKQYNINSIMNMTFSLSKFFRSSLSSGKDIVPISNVVEMINSYLNIISIRFRDKLSYEVTVDDSLKDYCVLKYIFQPIVENAVFHGIEKKKKGGQIKVSFKRNTELIKFSVFDNGFGISEYRLKEIIKSINSPQDSSDDVFALKNINSQIKLFYGDNYGLKIASEPGHWTKVEFEIPIIYNEPKGPDTELKS